jgi:uncharacterized protein YfaS (alpha-2-macroglobulin family)
VVFAHKGEDFAFALSRWTEGLETWRFGLAGASDDEDDDWARYARLKAHTILDRTLFKRGETVSMRHLLRWTSEQGLAKTPPGQAYKEVVIQHLGSEDRYVVPLAWDEWDEASTTWAVPAAAKLGAYAVSLRGGPNGEREVGQFRVSDFRLPAFTGRVTSARGKSPYELALRSHLAFLDSGPAKGTDVKYTVAVVADLSYFHPPRSLGGFNFSPTRNNDSSEAGKDGTRCTEGTVLVDGLQRTLNAKGEDAFSPAIPRFSQPCALRVEMSFFDPSGETTSYQDTTTVYPTSYLVGMRQARDRLAFAAADIGQSRPRAKVALKVHAYQRIVQSHRRRITGGFYAYKGDMVEEDRGELCAGSTNAAGTLACTVPPTLQGSLRLAVTATSASGEVVESSFNLWRGSGGEWENPSNDDRMTLAVDKARYKPGDVARLTASLPFARSWALVTVEREGVLSARVEQLSRDKPVVTVPINDVFAPNVFVGVLAVRGRISAGLKGEPLLPTALVDLGKPAFRAALAELPVDIAVNRLKVSLTLAKASYKPREEVELRISAKQSDGSPAKNARVTLAVVDAALLELSPNSTHKVLAGMYTPRSNTVQFFTSQLQVVGKRHYGKKAVPFGGGGGRRPVRELFDSLAWWAPSVALDDEGQALLRFRLNDSLTRFDITASAVAGLRQFGDARASLVTQQDIQLRATLPTRVRVGDDYQASVTLRNASKLDKTLRVQAQADGQALAERPLTLKAGESQELFWQVRAPQLPGAVAWRFAALDGELVEDELAMRQQVEPQLLPAVVAADLLPLGQAFELALGEEPGALAGQSSVSVALSNSPVGNLGRVSEFFDNYPHTCVEQQTSKALGYADAARFQALMDKLPIYIGAKGLLNYFPSEGGGNAYLTAYVLTSAHAAKWKLPDDALDRLLKGLGAFVTQSAVAQNSPDELFYAMEALARYRKLDAALLSAQPRKLAQLSNSQLVSLYAISRQTGPLKLPGYTPEAIRQELLNRTGSRGMFDELARYWYGSDYLSSLRFIELASSDPQFADSLARSGASAAQAYNKRRYLSTQEHAWTRLALGKVEAALKVAPLSGRTRFTLGEQVRVHDWQGKPGEGGHFELPYAGKATLAVNHAADGPAYLRYEVRQAKVLTAPQFVGVEVSRQVDAVQGRLDALKRGDILRVTLTVRAVAPLSWVAVSDPVPAGASVMERPPLKDAARKDSLSWPVYEEKGAGFYRAYFDELGGGAQAQPGTLQYYLRINTAGTFHMPETRVEPLYDPEVFARLPNAPVVVLP